MNPTLTKIIESVSELASHASNKFEAWDHIIYNGDYSDPFYSTALTCLELLESEHCQDLYTLTLDDVGFTFEELKEISKEVRKPLVWQFRLPKDSLINGMHFGNTDIKHVLFNDISAFHDWATGINPFNADSIFHTGKPLKIYVNGISQAFGGPRLAICPTSKVSELPKEWLAPVNLPSDSTLRTHIYVAASYGARLDPTPFLLNWGDLEAKDAIPFRQHCATSLAACLIQDFFDINRVIINGTKRLELPLIKEDDPPPSAKQLRELHEAVGWAYGENPETRVLLMADRLSLDIPHGLSYSYGINNRIKEALEHAKNKYKFVILERMDAHAKELSALQQDIRNHTDSYSNKIRGLLSNLLRDVLGALMLLGIGLFTKILNTVQTNNSADATQTIENILLYKILAIYFLASVVLQYWIHLKDLSLSKKEIYYWTNITRNHISDKEVKTIINNAIDDRKNSFYIQGGAILIIYISLALCAWHVQPILHYFNIIK